MKNQTLNLLNVSVLLVLVLTLISASNVTFSSSTTVLDRSVGNHTLTISVTSNVAQTVSFSVINEPSDITFSAISDEVFSASQTKQINLSYDVSDDFESDIEDNYVAILIASVSGSENSRKEYTFEKSYCNFGEVGKIEIDVEDEKLDNEKAWKWRPFNNIELTVNVENNADDDMSGTIEYCLYDEDEGECVVEDEMDFDVDEDEDEDFTIEFTIDPSDLNLESDNYQLYIKAYDDDNWDESEQCAEYTESISVEIDKNSVMIDDAKIVIPESVNAGDTITLEVPVYNAGSKDQEDVTVKFYSKTLSISNLEQSAGDLDSGDSSNVYFTFTVPTTAVAGKGYELTFEVYDEDDDLYEYTNGDGDDTDAIFSTIMKIDSSSSSPV